MSESTQNPDALAKLAARVAQPDLQNLPEWQVVEILNAFDPAYELVMQRVNSADARMVFMTERTEDQTGNCWVDILDAAEDSGSPARKAARAVKEFIDNSSYIDMLDDTVVSLVHGALNNLIQNDVITETARQKVLALAKRQQSWAEVNGVDVTVATVMAAKRAS